MTQGTWMGIYLAGGSLSRILGPIYLSYVYTIFGTWMTFGSIIAILVIALTINLSLFKHLIPLSQREPPKTCVL
jgi:MFS transporter, ceroid-lipofuscinosis neuronal protein 7